MNSPFKKELLIYVRNNEALDGTMRLTRLVNRVKVPIDLTGYTFKAQARKAKSKTAVLICDITVSIIGDPKDGRVRLFTSKSVIGSIQPVKGFWDFLAKPNNGEPDNMFVAPIEIDYGITEWDGV